MAVLPLGLYAAALAVANATANTTRVGRRDKDCVPVSLDKCGAEWWSSNCLKCASRRSADCVECCPECTLTDYGGYKYCECGKVPPPTPGDDTWEEYKVGGLDILSVTGGDGKSYDKVVILLHGGGGRGSDWVTQYNEGYFGDLTGFKYVFPTSSLAGNVWYDSYKNGCGLEEDCAYDLPSIEESGAKVAAVIEHEKRLVGGDASKVFLGGFSQGGQLTSYVQIAKLDYALGGAIVLAGFPLPPLCNMPGKSPAEAKRLASYYGSDMRWMVWIGSLDFIFPADFTMTYFHDIFEVLGVSSTVKVFHTQPGQFHTITQAEITRMVSFIKGE